MGQQSFNKNFLFRAMENACQSVKTKVKKYCYLYVASIECINLSIIAVIYPVTIQHLFYFQ